MGERDREEENKAYGIGARTLQGGNDVKVASYTKGAVRYVLD